MRYEIVERLISINCFFMDNEGKSLIVRSKIYSQLNFCCQGKAHVYVCGVKIFLLLKVSSVKWESEGSGSRWTDPIGEIVEGCEENIMLSYNSREVGVHVKYIV